MTEREESATETPPADEILPNGKNEETAIMQFDLHSDLANQITIENLKWHRDNILEDLEKDRNFTHEEDRRYYEQLFTHLNVVIGYFAIDEAQ